MVWSEYGFTRNNNSIIYLFIYLFICDIQTAIKDPQTGETKDKVTAFIVEREFGGVSS